MPKEQPTQIRTFTITAEVDPRVSTDKLKNNLCDSLLWVEGVYSVNAVEIELSEAPMDVQKSRRGDSFHV